MQIFNVGPYPPPFGGVSIHIQRLHDFLTHKSIESYILNTSNGSVTAQDSNIIPFQRGDTLKLIRKPKSIFHFHFFSRIAIVQIIALSLKHVVILSFHNERFKDDISKFNIFWRILTKIALRRCASIIVDNQKNIETASNLGINLLKIKCIPEFIPPTSVPNLPDNHKIMELRKRHRFIISSVAFQISFHKGEDLYGIDTLIDLTRNLVDISLDICFCFLLPQIGDQSYLNKMTDKINKLELSERFIFIFEPLQEASSLWKISDLVIRATNTDGNSLTILEALCQGTTVLASDCVERPEGTNIFRTRDLKDLTIKTKKLLANSNEILSKAPEVSFTNAETILNLYSKEENKFNF